MKVSKRRVLALLVCVLAAAYALTHKSNEPSRPRVLIITLDTLRPDHVGGANQTPAIDAFLLEATRFAGARTVAPLTLPAHASLFSGASPARHHVHDNGGSVVPPRDQRSFLLLAEQFRDRGYATAGFVSRIVLAPRTGIAQGFDRFDTPTESEHQPTGYVPARIRLEAALAWLRVQEGPYFCWVHFFDPHAPYQPFAGDAMRKPSAADGSPASLYAGEVRRVDAAVEQLLGAVADDTIVVLASDHGESLDEHREPTHGPLCYGSTIDAFLAIRADGFAPGAVDRRPRSLCDVAPTLRALCGLEATPHDGASLLGDGRGVVVSESLQTWRIHGWGQCFAATDGRYTLIESGPHLDLFDRARDPGEVHAIVPEGHSAYERLDQALLEYRRRAGAATAAPEMTQAVFPYGQLRRVDAAAYLSRAANARLLDPGEHLESWAMLEIARSHIAWAVARRNIKPALLVLTELDEIAKTTSDSPMLHHVRAEAYMALGEITRDPGYFGRAVASERIAIEKGYVRDETFQTASRACVEARDAKALRALLELAEQTRFAPDDASARLLRDALRLLKLESDPQAVATLRRVVARTR